MRNMLPLLIVLALPACASTGRPATSKGLPGPVTFEVSSWGQLLTHWQVDPDGNGEIWRRAEPIGKAASDIRKFRLHLDPPAIEAFVAAVEPLRRQARGGITCKKQIFDLPYGSIAWDYPGGRQSYAFDSGCKSAGADAAAERLKAAGRIVETMATIEPQPYMTEHVGPR